MLMVPLTLLAAALPACAAPAPAAPECSYRQTGQPARPVELPPTAGVAASGSSTLTLELNGEPVQLTLDRSRTPCTVNSFESLARQGYFDGTDCHRLADAGIFVLQCGDPTGTGGGGPGYAFPDELSGTETYPAGTLAMANAGPGTNGSQFFIVFEDTMLRPDYAVFGTVDAAGLAAVRAIAAGGQDGSWGDGTGKPLLPARITRLGPG